MIDDVPETLKQSGFQRKFSIVSVNGSSPVRSVALAGCSPAVPLSVMTGPPLSLGWVVLELLLQAVPARISIAASANSPLRIASPPRGPTAEA